MIKNAESLLKSLRTLVRTDEDEIWIDNDTKTFHRLRFVTESDTCIPFPPNEPSVLGLIYYLRNEGYIVLDHREEYLTLTYKAFYYEEFNRDECLTFIKRSVLIPIFLSLATNALLFFTQQTGASLLSLLKQWILGPGQ